MTQSQINPEDMTMEELVRLSNEELQQPRDDQGRFTSQQNDEPTVNESVEEQTEEIVYRRVIDLGDGSGTQVFEGESPEDLIEKLANAQVHATRKIREQAAELKAKANPPAEPQSDPADDFLLAQEMLTSPTKAMQKAFEKMTGMKLEDFKNSQERLNAFQRGQEEFQAGKQFADSHPDFYGSEKNAKRIEKWLRVEGLSATTENIEKAYSDLSESGLLEAKPSGTQDADTTERTDGTQRIAAPAARVVGQRRVASGLSGQRSTPVTKSQGPTEADLYNMPLAELEALARRQQQ
jgi:hypothetical protein